MVADALKLRRPEFAALIFLPVPQLLKFMPGLDPHWYEYQTALAYCSSVVLGTPVADPKGFIEGWTSSVAEIAAFDVWLENQDRNVGNFLRAADGDYVVIDNELILYSLLWLPQRQYTHNGLRTWAKMVLAPDELKRFEAAMILASDQHPQAFAQVSPKLHRFLSLMEPSPALGKAHADAVLDFLKTRSQPGWFASELGHVA